MLRDGGWSIAKAQFFGKQGGTERNMNVLYVTVPILSSGEMTMVSKGLPRRMADVEEQNPRRDKLDTNTISNVSLFLFLT